MNRGCTSAMAFVVALGGAVLITENAVAQETESSICYKVYDDKGDTYDRLYLDIKEHSGLGEGETSYSVHGKYIYVDAEYYDGDWESYATMNTATGTVVTKYPPDGYSGQTGARLGVQTGGGLYGTKNKTFDCTYSEPQAWPDSWDRCAIDGEDNYSLEKADDYDKYCDFFQDGEYSAPYMQ
jgi:hypothetical protein